MKALSRYPLLRRKNSMACLGSLAPQWLFFSVVLSTVITFSTTAQGSAGGRDGFSGAPNDSGGAVCSVCHTANGAQPPAIGIVGPNRVDAGSVQNLFVVMIGGPAATAGIDIALSDDTGSLQPFDSDLQLQNAELVHAHPKPFDGDLVTFIFRYAAPAYNGNVTIYAAGNSSNGNLDLQGDGIATTSHSLQIENGAPPPPPQPPANPPASIRADLFASGLEQPVAIANAGDERLFVVERAGRIRIIDSDGNVEPVPFLDIETQVLDSASELGLLGLAFHPGYPQFGRFYVYYTIAVGEGERRSRISTFSVSDDPNRADHDSEIVLMEFFQPFSNHNGGDMHFGPDGYLYIASGDGGAGGDPQNNGQNTESLLGKLLRIDVNAPPGAHNAPDCGLVASGYRIPPGNAFTDGSGGAGCDEIYALGLRNPWRFSFDALNGDIWIADVGQREVEEVNYVPAGSGGGLNFGWNCYEGDQPFDLAGCRLDYLDPVHAYNHADSPGGCSVTGGRVYRGSRYPIMQGQYFFSDFCQASIRTLDRPEQGFEQRVVLSASALSGVSSFGEDSAGELYVTELIAGTVRRLQPISPTGDVDGDADVDWNDLVTIWFGIGATIVPGDVRDTNGDGEIEEVDVGLAAQFCSRAACAIEM